MISVACIGFKARYQYFGARYYDSDLSVWLSVDPLSDMASNLTPYRYAFNNPTKYIDQNGLFESRKAARQYRRANNIKGRIRKGDDGIFNIHDKKNGVSYFRDPSLSNYNRQGVTNLDKQRSGVFKAATGTADRTMGDRFKNFFKRSLPNFIRNSPTMPTGNPAMPIGSNPLYQAEAASVDLGLNVFGAEVDAGFYYPLVGDKKGSFLPYYEYAGGVGTDGGVTFEFGRSDYTGNIRDFNSDMLFGYRQKGYIGVDVLKLGTVGYGYSFSNVKGGQIRTHQVSVGVGGGLIPVVNGGYNEGEIKKW